MTIDALMSDDAVLRAIGKRLARRRLELELTQAQLAEQAGVGKRTVERIEAGESTQTATLIRIVRILGLLDNLAAFIPEPGPRPLDLLKLKGKERRRASSRKQQDKTDEPWSWGDEE
jgi:transcriptional regulator with XRE-family HTH domain